MPEIALADDTGALLDQYRSRPKQLARWLLESRAKLKTKYSAVKVELKRTKVRVNDVSKSRDQWRQRAESSQLQLEEMRCEVERLAALVGQTPSTKKK